MNRNDLKKQIEKSLKKSLSTREAKALNSSIKEGINADSNTRLFELGWHLEKVKSERLSDLANRLSQLKG